MKNKKSNNNKNDKYVEKYIQSHPHTHHNKCGLLLQKRKKCKLKKTSNDEFNQLIEIYNVNKQEKENKRNRGKNNE